MPPRAAIPANPKLPPAKRRWHGGLQLDLGHVFIGPEASISRNSFKYEMQSGGPALTQEQTELRGMATLTVH